MCGWYQLSLLLQRLQSSSLWLVYWTDRLQTGGQWHVSRCDF